jgi:hypothetical protein
MVESEESKSKQQAALWCAQEGAASISIKQPVSSNIRRNLTGKRLKECEKETRV